MKLKKKIISLIIIAVGISALVAVAYARGGGGAGGGGRGNQGGGGGGGGGGVMFNTQAVVTISGEVTSVQRISPASGASYDVYLIVQMSDGPLEVYLGPGSYVDSRDIKIQVGDRVDVKGSKTNLKGAVSMIAAVVSRGFDVLTLRDLITGTPLWVGSKGTDQL